MQDNITDRTREALSAGIITGDGHTIFKVSYYHPYFTADELVAAGLVQRYHSDGTLKGSITGPDGNIVDYVDGVYNLHFLYWLAGKIGASTATQSIGRGFQAQELVRFMTAHLAA